MPIDRKNVLSVRGVSKSFGQRSILHEVDLHVAEGEFVSLLGPSGCGKTTLLRVIGGFETAERGSVKLDGTDISGQPAAARPINTVFQNYSLFPHLTVAGNVAFGLEMLRRPRAAIAARVADMLDLVQLGAMAGRTIDQLSGGQQQRVALARALAPGPRLLLLDEPLSALDRHLRLAMQAELRRLQRETGTSFVFVTHDQDEALALSDRIAVMRAGRIEQIGTPHEIYHRPATRFVAGFVGDTNLIDGIVTAGRFAVAGETIAAPGVPDGAATLAVKPHQIVIVPTGGFSATVETSAFAGASTTIILRLADGQHLQLRHDGVAPVLPGMRVCIDIVPGGAHFLPAAL